MSPSSVLFQVLVFYVQVLLDFGGGGAVLKTLLFVMFLK